MHRVSRQPWMYFVSYVLCFNLFLFLKFNSIFTSARFVLFFVFGSMENLKILILVKEYNHQNILTALKFSIIAILTKVGFKLYRTDKDYESPSRDCTHVLQIRAKKLFHIYFINLFNVAIYHNKK